MIHVWPPDAESWLIWKDPDAGKGWGREEKGTTKNEMVGWHHRLNGRGFGWTAGVGDGQGGLASCGSWGCKESETTEWLNWTEWFMLLSIFSCVFGYLHASSLNKYLFKYLPIFWWDWLLFLLLSFESSLYILETWLLIFLRVSVLQAKFLTLVKFELLIFGNTFCFCVISKNSSFKPQVTKIFSCVFF